MIMAIVYRVQTDSGGVYQSWLSMLPIGGEFIGGQMGGMYNRIGAQRLMSGSALVSTFRSCTAGSKTINAFGMLHANGKEMGTDRLHQRKLIMMLGLSQWRYQYSSQTWLWCVVAQ